MAAAEAIPGQKVPRQQVELVEIEEQGNEKSQSY